MKQLKLIISSVAVALLACTKMAYAANDVECPSLSQIQMAAPSLVSVSKMKDRPHDYIVTTGYPVISHANLKWLVGAAVTAKDDTEALTKARAEVKTASVQLNKTADYYGEQHMYVCGYKSAESLIVAIANKNNTPVSSSVFNAVLP